jgi:4-hydroxy-tetrahydrodipicolinate reductase
VIRVGVIGAAGRMGRIVCAAVHGDPDLELVGAVNPGYAGQSVGDMIGSADVELPVSSDLGTLADAGAQVVVDFTRPEAVMPNVRWAVEHGVHVVVGTSGVTAGDLDEVRGLISSHGARSNVIVAPNFAIGAVLLQRFAEQAARFFPAAEVIELHHEAKADAPSGTSLATAERIAGARDEAWKGPSGESVAGVRGGDVEGIRVHSVRLPGLVAHQEVLFGGQGQTLSLRHDSMDRSSFMPGVLLAIKAVAGRPGLTVGLDPLLDHA